MRCPFPGSALIARIRPLIPTLLALTTATASLPAQQVSNHRVFVGIDLFVPTADGPLPVLGFEGDRARLAGSPPDYRDIAKIPAFGWTHRPKVGRLPVIIRDLETRYESTVQADATQRRLREMNQVFEYAAERAGRSMQSGVNLFAPPSEDDLDRQRQLTHAAHAEFDSALSAPAARVHHGPFLTAENVLEPADAADNDVLTFSFDLVAPRPVTDAHLIVMAHLKTAGEPGVAVFHQAIGPIDAEPRRIKVRQTGFRPGFELTALKLHLFAHGQELPTNLSERTSFFTADEAHRFLLLAHIADHPHGQLPPQPVWSLAPASLFSSVTPEIFDQTLAVNVDADGHLLSIHRSETDAQALLKSIPAAADLRTKSGGAQPGQPIPVAPDVSESADELPPLLIAALRELVFLPALRDGEPVIGTTTINLADFFR